MRDGLERREAVPRRPGRGVPVRGRRRAGIRGDHGPATDGRGGTELPVGGASDARWTPARDRAPGACTGNRRERRSGPPGGIYEPGREVPRAGDPPELCDQQVRLSLQHVFGRRRVQEPDPAVRRRRGHAVALGDHPGRNPRRPDDQRPRRGADQVRPRRQAVRDHRRHLPGRPAAGPRVARRQDPAAERRRRRQRRHRPGRQPVPVGDELEVRLELRPPPSAGPGVGRLGSAVGDRAWPQ